MEVTKYSAVSSELIAVIAAAVAMLNTKPGVRLQVKGIKRLPQSSPVWNTAGRSEQLGKF